MELTQLKCFLAVAREGSFTCGAKACHISQPSLSYQISKLEEELGETLFIRRPKGVELSESGKLLLARALRIQEEHEHIVSDFRMRESLSSGEVVFGIIPTIAPYILPPLMQRFRRDYPQIRLVVRESRTSQLVREVVEGKLEFAIVSDIAKSALKKYSLNLTKLYEEDLLLAVANDHPYCGHGQISPKSIDAQQLILLSEGNCLRDQTVQLCQHPKSPGTLECEQLPTQLSMVRAGLGIAIVPEMAMKTQSSNELTFLRFSSPSAKRLIGLLKKRGGKLSLASSEFIKRLKEIYDG